MAEITAQLVKQLRDRTGAGMMECKSALVEANGDIGEAEVILRKRGIASATRNRARHQAGLDRKLHPFRRPAGRAGGSQLRVRFRGAHRGFQELVHDIAMHIAAADPRFIRKEDVPAEALDKERDIQRGRAAFEGKPPNVIDRIVEGRMAKFYEEVCLLEQPFVKEATLTVGQLIKTKIAKLGENITVSRFTRYKVGDVAAVESGAEGPPDASVAV
jgi:elongation factor Ts